MNVLHALVLAMTVIGNNQHNASADSAVVQQAVIDKGLANCIVVAARVTDEALSESKSTQRSTVTISKVFCGEAEIGEVFFDFSFVEIVGAMPPQHREFLVDPPLQVGDTGIWLLRRESTGELYKDIRRPLNVVWPVRERDVSKLDRVSSLELSRRYLFMWPTFEEANTFAATAAEVAKTKSNARLKMLRELAESGSTLESLFALRILSDTDTEAYFELAKKLLVSDRLPESAWQYLDLRLTRNGDLGWTKSEERLQHIAKLIESATNLQHAYNALSRVRRAVLKGELDAEVLVRLTFKYLEATESQPGTSNQRLTALESLSKVPLNDADHSRVIDTCLNYLESRRSSRFRLSAAWVISESDSLRLSESQRERLEEVVRQITREVDWLRANPHSIDYRFLKQALGMLQSEIQ